jgi:hypothetical protein
MIGVGLCRCVSAWVPAPVPPKPPPSRPPDAKPPEAPIDRERELREQELRERYEEQRRIEAQKKRDERIRRHLLAQGATRERVDEILATFHLAWDAYDSLTGEQKKALDDRRLDQVNFFNRPSP